MTQNWKNFEKIVAKELGGTRLLRQDYSLSQPDVIINNKEEPLKHITFLAECKYSINQHWNKYIYNLLKSLEVDYGIVYKDNILFFEIKNIWNIISDIMSLSINNILYSELSIIKSKKQIPSYINNWLKQAQSYAKDTSWIDLHPKLELRNNIFPLLVLGQKNSRTKIVALDYDKFFRFI